MLETLRNDDEESQAIEIQSEVKEDTAQGNTTAEHQLTHDKSNRKIDKKQRAMIYEISQREANKPEPSCIKWVDSDQKSMQDDILQLGIILHEMAT